MGAFADKLQTYETASAPPKYEEAPVPRTALAEKLMAKLKPIVAVHKLEAFFPSLDALVARLELIDFAALAKRLHFAHSDLAIDLCVLALYDVVILADDSGSMQFATDGRIEDLKVVISEIAKVVEQFDDDGIELRWFNSAKTANGVTDVAAVDAFFAGNAFQGTTPMGASLKSKVLDPLFHAKVKAKTLKKPVLVFVITDGAPDSKADVVRAIADAKKAGGGSVAFAIGQVGNDTSATAWLGEIDTDKTIGDAVDCTSGYEIESAEFMANGITLTPYLWLLKLTTGAIDPSTDAMDE